MNGATRPGLLAIDVGTSRVKLGWFPDAAVCDAEKPSQLPIARPRLPEPAETFAWAGEHVVEPFVDRLGEFVEQYQQSTPAVAMASVNPILAHTVEDTLDQHGLAVGRFLKISDLPLTTTLKEPEQVGIDRVLAAVAVNRVRDPHRPALVVSMGTACTINLVSADAAFQGGAILPGLGMAGKALHKGTASLPMITADAWILPEHAVGKNTAEAIAAGVFWGMIGAIEKLIAELSRACNTQPQLFFTGGDAPLVIEALEASGHRVRLMPHLVLSGIAIACEARP